MSVICNKAYCHGMVGTNRDTGENISQVMVMADSSEEALRIVTNLQIEIRRTVEKESEDIKLKL